MKSKYDVVRDNFIKNFLNRNYLWTCVARKEAIFEDMLDRSPFPFDYDYDNDVMMLHLGNNINISFHFTWNNSENNTLHLIKIY